jgi:hypothetical protein
MPHGFARGRVVYPCQDRLGNLKSRIARVLWRGKDFCATEQMLVNRWLGLRAIEATVSYGPSWLDGKPSLILDYSGTSRIWADVRDEMREVCPGVYVGAMYLRRCPQPKLKVFFILQAACPCCR